MNCWFKSFLFSIIKEISNSCSGIYEKSKTLEFLLLNIVLSPTWVWVWLRIFVKHPQDNLPFSWCPHCNKSFPSGENFITLALQYPSETKKLPVLGSTVTSEGLQKWFLSSPGSSLVPRVRRGVPAPPGGYLKTWCMATSVNQMLSSWSMESPWGRKNLHWNEMKLHECVCVCDCVCVGKRHQPRTTP